MISEKQKKTIVRYYRKPESRWGYHHYLWGAKHFGYYPDKKADISEEKAQILLQDLVAESLGLVKGMRVMDAGCGEGVVATYLAKRHSIYVTGLTLVPFEKKASEVRAMKKRVSKLCEFHVADYSHSEFPDNFFDAIYTTESLSHVPDPKDALIEFFRILKPGGRLALFEYTVAPDRFFSAHEMKMLDLVIDGSGMFGLKKIRHGKLIDDITSVGFSGASQKNISDHIKPSFRRLNSSAKRPYAIISRLGLRKAFVNTTASVEYYNMATKDLIRYYIFTAEKPRSRK